MNIFVTSKVISTTWYDGETIVNRNEIEEVLRPFRALKDAVKFVKEYDYWSDADVLDMMENAEMTEDLVVESFWIDDQHNDAVTMCTTVEFKTKFNSTIRFELYIEERELV